MISWSARIFLIILFSLSASYSQAQQLRGKVIDASSGGPLPSANIILKGTYTGTISNAEGDFELNNVPLPYTLVIRYIGYHSREIEFTQIPDSMVVIAMEPNVRELGEVVVTGGDPAVEIMTEVIRRKQIWRKELHRYTASAYSRQNLESDGKIASISETLSELTWDKDKGTREVVVSKRQTENLGLDENLANASFIPDFYDDNLHMMGFDMVGPTHPDAFRFYRFELTGMRTLDHLTVFDIKVTPRRKLQPTFEGTLAVVDSAFVLLEVDLRPNDALVFPPPIQKFDLWYGQQFHNFGGDFWLPTDVRVRGTIKIGIVGFQFPEITIDQLTRLTDYEVNGDLPDSLFKDDKKWIRIDSVKVRNDTLFLANPLVVPLTSEEEKAYSEIDSTNTLTDAFKPKGFLARLLDDELSVNVGSSGRSSGAASGGSGSGSPRKRSLNWRGSFMPDARFNRVDGLHLGGAYSLSPKRSVTLQVKGGYSIASKTPDYGASIRINPKWMERRAAIRVHYDAVTRTNYPSATTSMLFSSTNLILGRPDYFDYHRSEGFLVGLWHTMKFGLGDFELLGRFENHTSIDKKTDYSLLHPSTVQRENPQIAEGRLHSAGVHYVWGGNRVPFSIAGQNRIEVNVEVANADILGGDFTFGRYEAAIDRMIPTFYKRRLFPNSLYLRLMAGTSAGTLPLQRYMTVDASPGLYMPFGSLKTLASHPYIGQDYVAFHWEHHFRTIPFEMVGLQSLARRGWGILLYGSSARTFMSDADLQALETTGAIIEYKNGFHHEIGVSVNGILGLGRVNLTKRLDAPGLRIGGAFVRYF